MKWDNREIIIMITSSKLKFHASPAANVHSPLGMAKAHKSTHFTAVGLICQVQSGAKMCVNE
eukprot:1151898-Pelagomonas_calceolata.AAC.1